MLESDGLLEESRLDMSLLALMGFVGWLLFCDVIGMLTYSFRLRLAGAVR